MICPYYPTPTFLIFAEGVPDLLYYSHFVSIILSLLIGFFVFFKNKNDAAARALLLLSLSFSVWTLLNLIVWTNTHTHTIAFVWSFFSIFYALICLFCLYFVYAFLDKKGLSPKLKIVLSILFLPVVLFAPSALNFEIFDLTLCAIVDEGAYYGNYTYLLGFLVFLWILVLLVNRYRKASQEIRKQIFFLGIGIELFLFSFFITGYIAALLLEDSYTLEFYGLFGMSIFMTMLGYLIVKFKAFNIKLIAAQALVVGLILLVGSQFFFVDSTVNTVLVAVTFVLACIGGYFLVKSVKKEVEQREEIAKLADTLAKANERLKILDKMKSEFVSIASHQLRSPLTAIRGYASMLSEGSYGKLPPKALEAVNNIADSSKYMAMSVEDYLNVSRIEAGNMKYEYSDFNLKELAEKIVDEMRPIALKKGLVMVFRSDCNGSCSINADVGKTRQVIMNLIDNSMKYTPKGTITVVTHDDPKTKKMYVTIQDTGVGMSPDTLEEVFDKFVRAKNANQVNVTGTGLGLFVAKKMVTEMKGRVWAESEGEGKGATFHVEFPLLPGKYVR